MCYAVGRGLALVRLVVLLFVVIGIGSCGGGGDGGGSSGSKLFVADSGTDVIGSVDNPNPAAGNVKVDRIITGTSSNFISGNIPALFLDAARDQLYVSNETSIFVFNNARFANGPVDYSRRVAMLVQPAGGNFNSLYLDSTRDLLYVGDHSNGVRVYQNASTANETGAPANLPVRTITPASFATTTSFVRDIGVDAGRNILYVGVVTNSPLPSTSIFVYDGASTADGSTSPVRTIPINSFAPATMGLFIDAANDRLYVSDGLGDVFVYDSAHFQNGLPQIFKTIVLPSPVSKIVVDTVNDRLYAAGGFTALYIVPGVSTASGAVLATAALAAPGENFTAVAARP